MKLEGFDNAEGHRSFIIVVLSGGIVTAALIEYEVQMMPLMIESNNGLREVVLAAIDPKAFEDS